MNPKVNLLTELIFALNHIGLNWQHIMEDYLEYNMEQEQKSFEELSKIKATILDVQNNFQTEYILKKSQQ